MRRINKIESFKIVDGKPYLSTTFNKTTLYEFVMKHKHENFKIISSGKNKVRAIIIK